MANRSARSLVQLLIVIAIIGILIGLLLPAVQRIRDAAVQSRSVNNVRQIQLAVMNFCSSHDGRLPELDGHPGGTNPHLSTLAAILPQIEQGAIYNKIFFQTQLPSLPEFTLIVPTYVSPADPTFDMNLRARQHASYAMNAFCFQPGYTLAASVPDGSSNTIAVGEHYGKSGNGDFNWGQFSAQSPAFHRATFADGGPCPLLNGNCYGDNYPITSGNPPISGPAFIPMGPRKTTDALSAILLPINTPFQTAPAIDDCHFLIPQTPHRNGMITGMMDGSVHISSPSISQQAFWDAVTPAGGEIPSNFD